MFSRFTLRVYSRIISDIHDIRSANPTTIILTRQPMTSLLTSCKPSPPDFLLNNNTRSTQQYSRLCFNNKSHIAHLCSAQHSILCSTAHLVTIFSPQNQQIASNDCPTRSTIRSLSFSVAPVPFFQHLSGRPLKVEIIIDPSRVPLAARVAPLPVAAPAPPRG